LSKTRIYPRREPLEVRARCGAAYALVERFYPVYGFVFACLTCDFTGMCRSVAMSVALRRVFATATVRFLSGVHGARGGDSCPARTGQESIVTQEDHLRHRLHREDPGPVRVTTACDKWWVRAPIARHGGDPVNNPRIRVNATTAEGALTC